MTSRQLPTFRILLNALIPAVLFACQDEVPVRMPPVTAVAIGEAHSCGLAESGEAYCWGDGSSGQLGTGNTGSARFAAPVAGGGRFASLTAGGRHTCALTTDAVAWCWGANASGQLGIGGTDMMVVPTPDIVVVPTPLETDLRFVQLSAGGQHTCGVTLGGRAYCWGDGTDGKLGTGSPVANTSSPQAVATDLVFTRISAGARHTCGIVEGGEMYCWGANELAQLGTGAEGPAELAPARVDSNVPFADVSAGYNHSCAASASGSAYCWGENRHGEIGNTTRHLPDLPAERRPVPITTFGPVVFVSVSAGRFYSCGLRNNAELMCWGRGANGQLGNSEMSDHTVAQLVELEPGRLFVPGNGIFAAVDAGDTHTCGVTIEGTALCWGQGAQGQLGSGEFLTMIPHPVRLGAW